MCPRNARGAAETKEHAMFTRIALRLIVVIGVLGCAGSALGQDKVHNYFNDTALKVKATESPAQKRALLSNNLNEMTRALDVARNSSLTSAQDDVQLDRVRAALQEKSDELAGANGFERVPDDQLNAFSTYIVQDMEQADKTITIGVVTALLIVIILILIV
jgi:hypothetical protein